MTPRDARGEGKGNAAAVLAVAAVYVYFLIFAELGFLKTVRAGGVDAVKPVMAVMGGAGIVGSVAAAYFFSARRARGQLAAGFGVCALAAGGPFWVTGFPEIFLWAALVGFGAGFTTVSLAAVLSRAVGDGRLGWVVGLGTGLAYGFCNVPAVFAADAGTQAEVALLAAVLGVVAARRLELADPVERSGGADDTPAGVVAWTVIFFALVGLDSAVFSIIQQTPALKAGTWTGAWRLGGNAVMHLVAAVAAGWAFDRRWLGRTVLIGAAALLAACAWLDRSGPAGGGVAFFYTAGVSVYSAALAFYPARNRRPAVAALVYAVAGWGGSALGVAVAENRHEVPRIAVVAVAAVVMLALAGRGGLFRRSIGRQGHGEA